MVRLRRSPDATTGPDPDAVVAGEAAAVAAEVEAALQVPLDPRAAAFFDVDNTVMQGASIFHLARGLYARDFFTARDIGRFAWQQAKFRIVGREDMGNVHEARETALSFAAGHTVAELTTIGEQVFDEVMAT
jgi:phosphoserine phosphatase